MPEANWTDAIHDVLAAAFQADPAACLFLADGLPDRSGAAAIAKSCGEHRVRRAAVTPGSLVGIGAGAARAGARSVVELPHEASITQTIGHLADHVATAQYYSGGRQQMPLLIRAVVGHQDAAVDEASSASLPGMRVIVPSTAREAAGLVRTALQCRGPVLLLEPLASLDSTDQLPADEEMLDIDQACVLQRGGDVTLVAIGSHVAPALEAARQLQVEGLHAEVIDVRTIAPLDLATIERSVAKTGRVLVADMAGSVGGWGAELAAHLAADLFDRLDAPLRRRSGVASPEHPQLTADALAQAVRELAAQ